MRTLHANTGCFLVTLLFVVIKKKKCFRQNLRGIEEDIMCFYLFDFTITLKVEILPLKVAYKPLNGLFVTYSCS